MGKAPRKKGKTAPMILFRYGIENARDYWRLITRPDVEDWRISPSPRTAAHVIQSLWGLTEWIAHETGQPKESLRAACPDLKYIYDIANSTKHRLLDRPRKSAATAMRLPHSGHLGYSVAGGYGCPAGGYGGQPVVIDGGQDIPLRTIVDTAFVFLEAQLPP